MLLLSIGSCQPKDSQNTEPHIPISDQRLIDAATAKVGSYFVYQDSATGVTDSFYVTDYSLPYYEYQPTEQKWLQVTGYTAFNGISTYPGPRIGLGTSENKIVGYLWSQVSGPGLATIVSPSAASTVVRSLKSGEYIFQFAVIDEKGLTGVDTLAVKVNPSLPITLTLPMAITPIRY